MHHMVSQKEIFIKKPIDVCKDNQVGKVTFFADRQRLFSLTIGGCMYIHT